MSNPDFGPTQAPRILTVPGLGNSGPDHWQSLWEAEGICERVQLGLWDSPRRNHWVTMLHHAIEASDRPVVLAAHSLGCLTVAWWAALERPRWCAKVMGALLVAPPEVDCAPVDQRLAGFGPVPKGPLPFPSIVVASRNDPFADFERVRTIAAFWGSRFVDAGLAGHINAASELGDWDFGRTLLGHLTEASHHDLEFHSDHSRQPERPTDLTL